MYSHITNNVELSTIPFQTIRNGTPVKLLQECSNYFQVQCSMEKYQNKPLELTKLFQPPDLALSTTLLPGMTDPLHA